MLKEASAEEVNKKRKERIKDFISFIFKFFGLFCLLAIAGCLFVSLVQQFQNDREEILAVELPGDRYVGTRIIECRYPLGSIFNKDEIAIGSNGFVITTRSIWGSNIKTVPYSKIKQIELAEGMYWNSFTVKREGFWRNRDTIYFKENLTQDVIKNLVSAIAPEMVIIEKQTVFYRIGKDWEQPPKKKRDPRGIRK